LDHQKSVTLSACGIRNQTFSIS